MPTLKQPGNGVILLGYLLLGGLFFIPQKFLVEGDQIRYLLVAEHYASGEWNLAVNGLWSPLISWLLIPLLALPVEPVFLFKGLQLAIGFGLLYMVIRQLDKAAFPSWSGFVLKVSLMVVVLSWALVRPTPDLLFASLFLAYLLLLRDRNVFLETPWRWVGVAVVAALLYWSKAFGLPFFLAHFTLWTVYGIIRSRHSRGAPVRLLKKAAGTLVLWALIILPWVMVLSTRYDTFTYSTAGRYNWAALGPSITQGIMEEGQSRPRLHKGVIPPPEKGMLSLWEDPSLQDLPSWNPLASKGEWQHYQKLLYRNFLTFYYDDVQRQWGMPFMLLVLIYLVWSLVQYWQPEKDFLFFGWAGGLLLIGYLLIFVRTRFLWGFCLAGVMALPLMIRGMAQPRWLRWASRALVILMALLLLKQSFKQLCLGEDKDVSASALLQVRESGSFWLTNDVWEFRKALFDEVHSIREKGIIDGPFVTVYYPGKTLNFLPKYVSWKTEQPQYGGVKENDLLAGRFGDLYHHDVQYILTRLQGEGAAILDAHFPLVHHSPRTGIRIYRVVH